MFDILNISITINIDFFQTLANMGKEFGNLAKISGVVYFRLSPYEQKAFKGMVTDGVPNLIRRFQSRVFRVVPRKSHLVI